VELLVKASSTKTMPIQQFRNAVYQSVLKRADAFFNLLDALTVAGHVNSPVALSEEAPYERKFSSIFDTLLQGEFDFDQLLRTLYEFQPADTEQIAGFEIYGHDTTPNERPEAETLEDRGSLKAQKMIRSDTGTSIPGWCGWSTGELRGLRQSMCNGLRPG
jgi:hypothetical protein